MKNTMPYTQTCTLEGDGFNIIVCNDCGAYAETIEKIEHCLSCCSIKYNEGEEEEKKKMADDKL